MLRGIQALDSWEPIEDAGRIIGLTRGTESISLEPGGQFELSGAPLEDLHATRLELAAHLRDVHAVAAPLGLGFSGMGFHPLATREAMPWMPKSRYAIMRRYMPLKGSMGLDMMLRTATVQVNLDFGDEADMVEKLRVSLALQPLATALFASSPLREGRPSGYRSLRGHVWSDTDGDRTGIPACVFEDGFGFERFAEHVLDVPMYFVAREGALHDVAGASFREFMARGLDALPGEVATMGDVADHVTTVFTEVRLKRFLEMRGATRQCRHDPGQAGLLGRAALRRRGAEGGAGAFRGLDGGADAGAARRGAGPRPGGDDRRAFPARRGARRAGDQRGGACARAAWARRPTSRPCTRSCAAA
jgi:glutamate--cysteine ligase